MGMRQKEWARKARKALKGKLGGCCAICGSKRNLEFDCIQPQGHAHHWAEPSTRLCFYRKQYAAGNLQILCRACHIPKSRQENQALRQLATTNPF